MNETDAKVFEESISDCYAMYDAVPKDLGVWWSACHRYPMDIIAKALVAHMQDPEDGRFPPKPADVIRRIANKVDGHLPADEAWAIAIQAMDESETVVWTQEIAEAWGAAKLIMQSGDEVGARMAFRSAYERRVTGSRANGRNAKWFPSLGHDPAKRAVALEAAADRLRLPHLAEQAAIEDQSRQPPSSEVSEWVAQARRTMRFQAPRPGRETPLDEVVAALPEDCEARRRALAEMAPDQERRVRHVLGEAEKRRQLGGIGALMTPEERERWARGMAA